jgi:putative ABC transport system permease protein
MSAFLSRLSHTARLGLRSLAAHRLRSGLTTLGIVLGVASVIVMLSVGEAAREEALRQLRDLGANTIVLQSVKPTEDQQTQGGQEESIAYGLTYLDLARIQETIPTVKSATPMREFRKNVWHRDKKIECRIVSVTPDFLTQNNIKLLRGRGIDELDEANLASVIVLGAGVAEKLFPAEDPVGKTVVLESFAKEFSLKVIGVTEEKILATGGESNTSGDFTKAVFIPFEMDRKRIGKEIITLKSSSRSIESIEISQIIVSITELSEVQRSAEALKSLINQYHAKNDVELIVPLDLLRKAEETQQMFTLILGAIAGISLVVGGIGIMNIMLATVTERTREIGIRRALGAKQKDIALQFLVETLVLTCGGGVIGVVLGVGTAYFIRWIVNIPTIVVPWSLVVAFGVSVLVGLASGLYPARRAAKLDPIEALRHS